MLQLRPFQKAALEAIHPNPSHPSHLLCIAPTGAGKSLIYERLAAAGNRRTLLVTPLVALARQQFQTLQGRGIQTTLGVRGSSQGPPQSKSGAWIVSPESLTFPSKERALLLWKPNLLIVDECHCLWEWGEKFRPAFTILPDLLTKHEIAQSLWLTATLPFEARLSLRQKLPTPLLEMGGFELPRHLQLKIHRISLQDRASYVFEWLKQRNGPGIVFVSTREATIRIGRLMSALGRNVVIYHGGMSTEERKNIENLVAQGIPDTVVATSAFGMGMNYQHLKFVILWQAPTSLLSLVQTIGRVGRNPASDNHALVLWEPEDFRLLEWTVNHSKKRQDDLTKLFDFLATPLCRSAFLKTYFDRTPLTASSCSLCDNCLTKIN
ncbi:MAG: DEAD/DEAH box helicase [Bdellovibrionia bacterium]